MPFDTRPDRDAEVVLVGRSNVGKSTLMRELTGHDVATGGKPGVTRQPNHFDWTGPEFLYTDLPGFGFMSGVPDDVREQIKTDVVRYVEDNADRILAGVLVVDGNAAVEIIDRHSGPDEVPHDVELFSFLRDVDVPPVVAVNKMDKVDDRDERLDVTDWVCSRRGSSGTTPSRRSPRNAAVSTRSGRHCAPTSLPRTATNCCSTSSEVPRRLPRRRSTDRRPPLASPSPPLASPLTPV